jgi:hypothetical protein
MSGVGVAVWRPIRHLVFAQSDDGSRWHCFCGNGIPSSSLQVVSNSDEEVDWKHPDLCRRCLRAWAEWTDRRPNEETPR